MDLRKVQLTGGSSISVTLPKSWVSRVRIQAGDIVGCIEQPDGSLAITPQVKGERPPTRYEIDIEPSDDEYLFRKVIAAYLMGYDAIVVRSKKPLTAASRLAIRRAVRRIIGLEIVEEEPSSITVQDFLDPREFHLDKALRRMSMLTQAMQDEALTTVRSPDPDALKSVDERDDEVDRLYWLVNKQYHAMLRDATYAARMELTSSQALNYLLVARIVERTADHAVRITAEALRLPAGRISDAFLKRLEKQGRHATDLFRESLTIFHKKDAKKANALIDRVAPFQNEQEALLKEATTLDADSVSHLAYVIESIGRTAAYAADVGEVAINHKVASVS